MTNPQLKRAISNEERQEIIKQLTDPNFAHLSIRQLHQTMLHKTGKYIASVRSYYRIAKAEGLMRKIKPRRAHRDHLNEHDFERRKSCSASAPNQVWMWDISYFNYGIGYVYLFLVMDLYSRKIVAAKFYKDQSAESAVELFKQAFADNNISVLDELVIHSDNGAAMRSELTVGLFKQHGVKLLLSRPLVSNDNSFVESLFRSLKYPYRLDVSSLSNIDLCNKRLDLIIQSYNIERPHSSINFVPPAVRHQSQEEEKLYLNKCKQAQDEHFKLHPERYIQGKMRTYQREGTQYLNPSAEMVINDHKEMSYSKSLSIWAKRLKTHKVLLLKDGKYEISS